TLRQDRPVETKPSGFLRLLAAAPKNVMAVLDMLCVAGAWGGSRYVLAVTRTRIEPQRGAGLWALLACSMVMYPVLFVRYRLYLSRFVGRSGDEFKRIVHASTMGTVSIAAFAFAVKINVARSWVILSFVMVVLLVTLERLALRWAFRSLRQHGRLLRSVVVIGSNSEGRALCQMIDEDPTLGYRVVGMVDDQPHADNGLPQVLGPVEQTLDIVRQTAASGVVIAATALDLAGTNRLVRELTEAGVHVELSSSLRDIASNRLIMRPLGRFPVVYVEAVKRNGWRSLAKRCFDVAIASFLLVISAPILFVAAIAIKLDSPGPVIFKQERVGRDGRRFKVFKLRTMVIDAEMRLEEIAHLNEADGPLFKVKFDPRVTRVGRFLRKTSFDELPQLINVMRDEMSMVGPRPALPREVNAWDPELQSRLRVRPGITGMWQVSGRSESSFEDYQRLDLYYVDNWSLVTDLTIIVKTVPAVVFGRGAH
ncbi:MAG TPA: sugar transferase, partial [Acidimicrobiales bacterium]|nr:sugar transferase [Acidimicrobiales bacterium]